MNFWQQRFYKDILTVLSGSVLAQVIGVFTMPVLGRMYSPAEFGVYQLFLSFFNVLVLFGTARYELAIVLPRYRVQAVPVMLAAVLIGAAMAGGVAFAIVVFWPYRECLAVIGVPLYAFYLPVHLFSVCLYQVLYMWFVREQRYAVISRGLVLFTVGNVLFCVGLHFVSILKTNLILALVLARLLVVVYFMWVFFKYYRRCLRFLCWQRVWGAMWRYQDFPKYMLAGSLLNSLSAELPSFLLNAFFGMAVTGWYALANRCLYLPVSLASKSVGDVFKQEAARIYALQGDCQTFFDRNLKILFRMSCLIGAIFFFFGPEIFVLFLGEEWRMSGEYSRVLALMFCAGMIAYPLNNVYIIAERQRLYMMLQGIYLLVTAGALTVGWYIFGDVTAALVFLSVWATSVHGVSICYGRQIAGRRHPL